MRACSTVLSQGVLLLVGLSLNAQSIKRTALRILCQRSSARRTLAYSMGVRSVPKRVRVNKL